jgi:hypothetical protein
MEPIPSCLYATPEHQLEHYPASRDKQPCRSNILVYLVWQLVCPPFFSGCQLEKNNLIS